MKTKVDIISGFLGAGKTTLIKKLLEEKLHREKVVLIENEFGEVGIDGAILKRSNLEVKEINSGCICCTLVGSFESAVQEAVQKYKPDRIIIEPSGVGKLSDVMKACDTPKLREVLSINMVVTVVDVLRYQIYISNFGEFYENQIKNARTVILSRTQNADAKKLESIVQSLHKLNSKANIITTPWELLKAEHIIAVGEEDASLSLERQLREVRKVVIRKASHPADCKCGCGGQHQHSHRADEVFEVWGVETPRRFPEGELRKALSLLSKTEVYGTVLRGKGIVQVEDGRWVQFDYVPGETGFKENEPQYTGRLCIIGSGLKKEKIQQLFKVN